MDYISFSKKFFSATGIPVNLLYEGRPVYSALGELLSFQPKESWKVYPPSRNPEFSAINPDLEYGHVRIEGTGYDLFLGPVFTSPVTEDLVRAFLADAKTPPEYWEAVTELLYSIPIGSHPQFIRYLLFLHLCLNHEEAEVEDFYVEPEASTAERGAKFLDTAVEAKENEQHRNSFAFEMELYHRIAEGDPNKLKRFLEQTQQFPDEGKTAHSPLRHAKNTFIAVAAKVGVLAAIPGGMDAERVYQLTDLYMMECEQMQTIEKIHRLQYIMLMDFCERCGAAKLPKGISQEIYRCMTYIQSHTNAPIGVEDVAEEIHRSSSYLMRRFKAELGMSVGDYITKCKLDEACDLLTYGNRSLAEISAYLGYSSQSYFQNVFKKQFGITPMQYRKENRKAI
ncbi:MAG: helix-turn-helix transcriptional regulator [Firmicutes bacterium]|nr:helix-turn-helix transcriptional regulator [Bacillota bacterium]